MKKNGFTLIELLICLAIIAVLLALILPLFSSGNYKIKESPVGKVVRKYEVRVNEHSQFRVDVKKENGAIDTVVVANDSYLGRYDADTVYANLEEGNWYQFSTVGKRDEYWQWFPNVITASKIPPKDQ